MDARNILHDKQVYENLNDIMNEQKLLNFIEDITVSHDCPFRTRSDFGAAISYLEADENYFLSEKIRTSIADFVNASKNLMRFMSVNFFATNSEPLRLWLHPELNIDRATRKVPSEDQRRQYDLLSDELDTLSTEVRRTYSVFRAAIKSELAL